MEERKESIVVNIGENQTIIELSEKLRHFNSDIYLKKIFRGNVMEINVKSFLGLVTMHLENGDSVIVRAVGDDCEEALKEVVKFLT